MLKYLILVLVLIFGSLGWMYFGVAVPKVYHADSWEPAAPHFFGDPERSIKKIEIHAFYFVPKNKESNIEEGWYDLLEKNLKKLKEFHSLQFQGYSDISYKIYHNPVVGSHDNVAYDTDITQGGNPKALINVAEEIEKRGLVKRTNDEAYPVMFIMYEGVGAVGGVIHESELGSVSEIAEKLEIPEEIVFEVNVDSVDGFFLVNKAYLYNKEKDLFGPSVFAHEFYHTLGVPDSYHEGPLGIVATTNDIMGLGRKRPLEITYLGKDVLKNFGF